MTWVIRSSACRSNVCAIEKNPAHSSIEGPRYLEKGEMRCWTFKWDNSAVLAKNRLSEWMESAPSSGNLTLWGPYRTTIVEVVPYIFIQELDWDGIETSRPISHYNSRNGTWNTFKKGKSEIAFMMIVNYGFKYLYSDYRIIKLNKKVIPIDYIYSINIFVNFIIVQKYEQYFCNVIRISPYSRNKHCKFLCVINWTRWKLM